MPLKPVIYEHCPGCGEKITRIAKTKGMIWSHECKGCPKPPGPSSPPRTYFTNRIIYIEEPDYEVLAKAGIYQIK